MSIKRKKIIYLVTQSEWGGAQKYIYELATRLSRDEFDILVAAGVGNGELLTKLQKQGIAVCQLRHTKRTINPLKDILAIFELIALFKKEKPDIIHLNSSKIGILGSLAAKITSILNFQSSIIIYTVHGWVFNEPLPCLLKKLYLILEKWTSRFKDKIIVVSEYDREIALKYKIAPAEKLITIRNGIDVQNLIFLDRKEARHHLFNLIEANNFKCETRDTRLEIIGTIANLYATKGLDYLIASACELIKTRPNLVFLIIGDGPEKQKLGLKIANAKLSDNIILLGKVDNAHQYLKAFDIFVLPSVKEGWPYTVLEASIAGLPIIATRVGGLPEMLSDQQNGLLVPPANPDELTQAINLLLDNPELVLKLRQNSHLIAEKFSLETTLKSTQKLYQ